MIPLCLVTWIVKVHKETISKSGIGFSPFGMVVHIGVGMALNMSVSHSITPATLDVVKINNNVWGIDCNRIVYNGRST